MSHIMCKCYIFFAILATYACPRCQCPPLFDGPECQQTKHTFLGDGYAWFPPIKPCFKSHISLEFITESADGLLLYNGPLGVLQPGDKGDFIALGKFTQMPKHLVFSLSPALFLFLVIKNTQQVVILIMKNMTKQSIPS